MSHFTILVPARDEQELEAKLLPYHEYECTGIEAYLQFVPTDMEDLHRCYVEHGKGGDFEQFAQDWGGYTKNEQGVYGRTTNPQAKWDWWVVGGRWTGLLKLLPGATGGNGTPSLLSQPNQDPFRCDTALVGDVNTEAMKIENTDENGFLKALTFAFIDLEGKWNERGRMGWFAVVTDKNPDYDLGFWEFWNRLPDSQRVYVIDAHI